MIYDRPVTELMRDVAKELSNPCSNADIVRWFARSYPKVKEGTVRAHVVAMSSNNPSRKHFRMSTHGKGPVWHRTAEGMLEPFDPDLHLEEALATEDDADGGVAPDPDGDVVRSVDSPEAAEFVMEAQLETFLLGNWNSIDWGRPLELWEGTDGETGHQLITPVGILDFLCRDTATDALVVVELKRGKSSDRVVGQAARYMGWVRHHLASTEQAVEGIIVAHEYSERLQYAATSLPGLSVLTYGVTFVLHPMEQLAEHPEGAGSRVR